MLASSQAMPSHLFSRSLGGMIELVNYASSFKRIGASIFPVVCGYIIFALAYSSVVM